MKIHSLSLENYRCFDKLDIDFNEQLTVIVGVNGSGKTAILEAVSFFLKYYTKFFKLPVKLYNSGRSSIIRHNCEKALLSLKVDFFNKNATKQIELNGDISDDDFLSFSGGASSILSFAENAKGAVDIYTAVVYYSAKRIIDTAKKNANPSSELKDAFNNAFNPGIDFSSSLAWFIERATQEALEAVQKKDLDHTLPDLSAVRMAISKALGDYDEPFIGETPPALFIRRKGDATQQFRIEELSDGYRTMLALVMDLARRMAVANKNTKWPEGQSVLCSPGVVLIDEVELHLHPSWQQSVLPSLMEIFPNVQFIVTTHSPQVLTSIAAKHIRILKNGAVQSFPDETEGAEASRVLEDVLLVSQRPSKLESVNKLERYADLVYAEKWDSSEAKTLRDELYKHYGSAEPRLKELELHIENSKWERGL